MLIGQRHGFKSICVEQFFHPLSGATHSSLLINPRLPCFVSSLFFNLIIIELSNDCCAVCVTSSVQTYDSPVAPSQAPNSFLRPAAGNPHQPHTELPLKANESFIMIL